SIGGADYEGSPFHYSTLSSQAPLVNGISQGEFLSTVQPWNGRERWSTPVVADFQESTVTITPPRSQDELARNFAERIPPATDASEFPSQDVTESESATVLPSKPARAKSEAAILAPGGQQTIQAKYGQLPLSFEINRGQVDAQVRFLSRGPGYNL